MEGGQTNEFRPLILVAEDDDSNFKLIKAIIGKKCDIRGPRMAKKSWHCSRNTATRPKRS